MSHPSSFSIGIVGLGYVGLPLAKLFLEKGHTVHGIDIDANKVNSLLKRQTYLSDFSRSDVKDMFTKNSFFVSSSFESIEHVDAVLICVPTPLTENHEPDLNYVIGAVKSTLPYLQPGQLIVLESSTFPGTVDNILLPLIESEGFVVGRDVSLAYSPERIDPGSHWKLEDIPKIVGGVTSICTERAKQIYESAFSNVVVVSSPRVAEMTKLLENSQRFINISFMNSLVALCEAMNINLWEVIDAAGTKPYGFMKYYPGPGIGGHCIPVDPIYLLWAAKNYEMELPFIELSQQVNDRMPEYVVEKVKSHLAKSTDENHILIIGVTYKKNVNDIRESSAPIIIAGLLENGYKVSYHDPYVEELQIGDYQLKSTPLTARNMKNYACTVILTDHSQIPYELLVAHSPLVIDFRNATKHLKDRNNVIVL